MKGLWKILVFSLTLTQTIFSASGQDSKSYIIQNAIPFNKPDSLNENIYKILSNFQVIMVGEMHGTDEPAKLVIGLTKLFIEKGENVQVGLEIPSEEMDLFLNHKSDSSIYYSNFFSKKATDGRQSFAWAELIKMLKNVKNVKLFFFDVNKEEKDNSSNRDSIMYTKIKNQILKNPTFKTITLSGNIHNMLLPFRETNTMATFLINDKEINISDKICSLNHRYKSGTMCNNKGSGLEISQVNDLDSDFSTAVAYNNYLLLLSKTMTGKYNGIYFTRSVTAAKMVRNK